MRRTRKFEIKKVIWGPRECLQLKKTFGASENVLHHKRQLRRTRRFEMKNDIWGTREDLTLKRNIWGLREGLTLKMTFEAHEKV